MKIQQLLKELDLVRQKVNKQHE